MSWDRNCMWLLALAFLVPIMSGDPAVPAGGKEPEENPEQQFRKPPPEEALRFLKSLPRVWRNTRDYDPKGPSKKILVQLFEDYTLEDLKTVKVLQPGGHVEDPTTPTRFSKRHLRIAPMNWWYFTAFEQLEVFKMGHDMEGVTDECLFFLGHLPQSMQTIKLEMSEATGEGVKCLQDLQNLKSLSLNFSRTIGDVALFHAAGIESLEELDVCGCPRITGAGVAALAGLEKLRVLKIGSCSLSDASLRHFLHLPVEELDMSHVEEGWIVEYRGGGHCRFTVSYAGLQALLTYQGSLPNLKRLVLRKTQFSDAQKQALASLRPGLEVR